MTTAPDRPDQAGATDRRRVVWIVGAAVLLPVTLMLLGGTGHPEWGFVVIAVVFPALFVAGKVIDRRTRANSDERALEMHRRAATFSWQVTVVALVAVTVWVDLRQGIRAAEPYLALTAVLLASYVGALLWRRWRGF
jgi:hypothetical protein